MLALCFTQTPLAFLDFEKEAIGVDLRQAIDLRGGQV